MFFYDFDKLADIKSRFGISALYRYIYNIESQFIYEEFRLKSNHLVAVGYQWLPLVTPVILLYTIQGGY